MTHPAITTPDLLALAAIDVHLTPADDATAAILKLAAAHGLTVRVVAIESGEPLRLDLTATLTADEAPVRLSQAETGQLVGAIMTGQRRPPARLPGPRDEGDPALLEQARRAAYVVPPLLPADAPGAPPDRGLDVFPAEADAVFRPKPPVDPGLALVPLRIVGVLTMTPRLARVAEHLLKPLVLRHPVIEGDAEAVLTRLAEEFAAYTRDQLACAAKRLLGGRHLKFPDRREIAAALGVCSRPLDDDRSAA